MREQAPCGTTAAARRHYRHGEPLDYSCRQAMARDAADSGGRPGQCAVLMADPRPVRNDLAFVPYAWRDPARMTPERLAELAALDELEALLDALADYAQTITSDALPASEVTSDGPDPPRLRGLRQQRAARPDGSAVVAAA